MVNPSQRLADDPQALRRCMRELVGLSTLSAVWSGQRVEDIGEGLCRVLSTSLGATFVYVRLGRGDGPVALEIAGTPRGARHRDHLESLTATLEPLLDAANLADTATVPNPFGTGTLRIVMTPIGHSADYGLVVAGSSERFFPAETHRLLLNVATNQAVIVLQQKRSEEQLRRSELELSDFFDNATVALHWVGPDGRVLRANRAELELLGYASEEYIGRHIADFHVDADAIAEILRRLSAAETLRDRPARMRCKDGSIKHVLIDSSVLWEQGRFVHTRCFTRDVTEQLRAEWLFQKQSQRLRLLWEAAAVLLTADDPDAMLRGLLAKVGEQLGVDAFFNFMVTDAGDALRLAACEGIPAGALKAISRLEFGQAVCGTVAQQRRPIVATHIQQSDDPKVQLVKAFGLRAYACNPLIAGDRLLGTLSFASRSKDDFEPDEVAFIETISHYATVAYERLRLLDQLKEADLRKDEFLATLAHELRNPLAPARSAVHLLRLTGPDEPQLRWARDVIDRQIAHLTRLIDDLMDVSRITRNRLELRKQRLELADVIRGAVESARPIIEQYGHTLTIALPDEPVHLDGDLVRLSQIFLNLLNNAAKYTEPGGRIWLEAVVQGHEVVVRVKDSGVGIPPEKLTRVFEMFFQVDRTLERARGGLGIGLSLVRRLVDLHGGSIEARSEGPGTGSEFVVRLPVLRDAKGSQPSAATAASVNGSVTRRILIVDDNRDSADALAMILRVSGDHEVHTAYDGSEGVALATRVKPDAVLLDIGMPHMNGFDVCRCIREQPWGRQSVLIAMTGWAQEDDRRRTADAGFDAHLVKPIDPGGLVELLSSLSARGREGPDGPRSSSAKAF